MLKLFKKKHRQPREPEVISYPENSALLWNKGLAMLCDHHAFESPIPPNAYRKIKKNDLVWVRSKNISQFEHDILPTIDHPFILVTTYGTRSMPRECGLSDPDRLVQDDRIIHWFTQNLKYDGQFPEKVSAIPIGLDFHSQWEQGKTWRYPQQMSPREQEAQILAIREQALSPKERMNKVYADFQFNNPTRKLKRRDPEIRYDRKEIAKILKKQPTVQFQKNRVMRHVFWENMAQYRFVISPHGVGLDCHRTWEALVLGCFVIVMRSSIDPLYEELPVVIVADYREITPDQLEKWSTGLLPLFSGSALSEKLTNRWWLDHMRAKRVS